MIYVVDREILYEDVYADVGESVTIPCHRSDSQSVLWQYKRFGETNLYDVYDGQLVFRGYVTRCTVNNSTYDLTIREVEVTDTGEYWCIEGAGFGVKHITKLFVTGTYCCCNAIVNFHSLKWYLQGGPKNGLFFESLKLSYMLT